MELVLANLLFAHAPLAAMIGNRLHWDELPQGVTGAAGVMRLITSIPGMTYQGAIAQTEARVQFDWRASTADERRAIVDALDARLNGFKGVFDGIDFQGCFKQSHRTSSLKDGAARWFTASVDYQIWWAPA